MAALLAIIGLFVSGFGNSLLPSDTAFVADGSFGAFERATRITVGPQGRIYVIDAGKNAVLIFKSPQASPFILGGYGWTSNTFDRPTGVTTDGLNIYISDYGNHRIQRFDRYSNLISSLSTRDTTYAPARFGYPTGVALTNLGDLLILDSENLRVVEFSVDSRFERNFGDLNTAGGKLQFPIKICPERDKFIYVLEKDRIISFDYYGNYLKTFATGLSADIVGGQSTPNGIVAVSTDTLYWFTSDGLLATKTPIISLIAEQPLRAVQDVAFHDNRLYVLTPHRCEVFTIQSSTH
jgi:DNA-binding beta-propeller fold protein YncE